MKRKKLYSALALGMAITLMAGVPVSAAPSPGAGSADFPVVGPIEEGKTEDGQDIKTGTDEAGNVVYTEVTADGEIGASAIEDIKNNAVKAENEAEQAVLDKALAGKVTLDDSVKEEVKVDAEKFEETATEETKAELRKDSQAQFEAVKKEEIKADKNVTITVTPVAAAAQSVAKAAAEAMAGTLGLNIKTTETTDGKTEANIEFAASMDISIPQEELDAAGGSVQVTIPMAAEKPDPSRYVYYVLHYHSTRGWETLPAQVTADGIVVATFDSFSPVFVVKAEKAAVETPVQEDNGGSDDYDKSTDYGLLDKEAAEAEDAAKAAASAGLAKTGAAPTVTGVPAAPSNPAVSPKTGE